jgi:peptide/nickel transport system permease protein
MSAPAATAPAAVPSARQIARARRRRALVGFWREYRKDRGGMIGLIVLVVLVVVALGAPLLADSSGLSAAAATYPANAGPGWHYPLGTDADGRSG